MNVLTKGQNVTERERPNAVKADVERTSEGRQDEGQKGQERPTEALSIIVCLARRMLTASSCCLGFCWTEPQLGVMNSENELLAACLLDYPHRSRMMQVGGPPAASKRLIHENLEQEKPVWSCFLHNILVPLYADICRWYHPGAAISSTFYPSMH